MSAKLVLDQVSKVYKDGPAEFKALEHVSLKVEPGEFVAVMGPSGSGKSTFLSITGALLSPTEGRIQLNGQEITRLSSKERTKLRLEKIGFVFQSSNLIPYLTVRDQLLLISRLAKMNHHEAELRSQELLEHLELSDRTARYPSELSGGQRQRVAIARALMNDPEIILADEPTASLDSKRGREVVELLAYEIKSRKKSGIMVTHDERVLDMCDRIITIKDGRLIHHSI
ncbi:putative ABC transporter ATP-binding protein YvrO [Paenibacillus larvae subsp. larvae]|uniref:Putative hemin import ATP-binding protein HrtA n=1 Tax=Paenibacillus larvae subsp. larvae TaxID=147375 RepID=A0A2L1U204_9BACL|nr:ABC transporter ATP-binding protein [Paenibacillus larvae]AVF26963.1 putative ABC transporter ATP-binding protein YvrO [Paenibacillus larvae subsp. larvae]AVF31710.1 putative ABC transporter ATP-binding protein YvrO [Paenibacillus larvae subsp. larvae]MCY7521531.1 ABC transporter ATP-binding protein [Paenibacillus larvae]MCY9502981.1 ABC transporter ATP-binding protein [Paenibacillus larvae]MCY9511860.1 ABC transporter ATP-binding protein [Paenibacillus larvae]